MRFPALQIAKWARYVYRALLGFESTKRWFYETNWEVTGLPVRPEFFKNEPKSSGPFTLLITGGSRGARKLNQAAQAAWPLFRHSPIRVVHQTGTSDYETIAREFPLSRGERRSGAVHPEYAGCVLAQADLVLGRAGAGGVSEIAAAGMPAILIPFPFAADDHQRRNAEALVAANAARMIADADLTGERLFEEVQALSVGPGFAYRDATERETVCPSRCG